MSQTLPPVHPAGEPSPESSADETSRGLIDRLAASPLARVGLLVAALGWLAYAQIWVFVFVMALVLCIFLHELGHYLVAKRNGMKVTEFFLGFGPRIWSFRRGETEYGIKLIWAGAYVRIVGMSNLEEVPPADEARCYRAQPFLHRVTAVLAGPAMNLALGLLLLFVVTAGFGRPSDSDWTVREITPGSAAEQAGIQPGDRIVSIDGQPVETFGDLVPEVQALGGSTANLGVERDGTVLPVTVDLGWSLNRTAAEALGMGPGVRITAVGGTPVATYDEVVAAVEAADGPVELTYDGPDGPATVTLLEAGQLPAEGAQGFLGVSQRTGTERVSPAAAVGDSFSQFGEIVVGSVQGMGRLFSPSGIGNLVEQVRTANDDPEVGTTRGVTAGGDPAPVASAGSQDTDRPLSILGIVNVGGQAGDEAGWAGVLSLLALVNIVLGLINLVPLLPFDGGHIAVACYEGVRSRIAGRPYRVDMAKLMPVTYVVFVVMVGLFVSTLYLDAVDPISIR